ncbi:hypothetical protein LX36DRAFT_359034 [Colletotrichum falcatum]|nr:hypothetical protein LX36DRAFT_359034 [Colletotrichum falcatum]
MDQSPPRPCSLITRGGDKRGSDSPPLGQTKRRPTLFSFLFDRTTRSDETRPTLPSAKEILPWTEGSPAGGRTSSADCSAIPEKGVRRHDAEVRAKMDPSARWRKHPFSLPRRRRPPGSPPHGVHRCWKTASSRRGVVMGRLPSGIWLTYSRRRKVSRWWESCCRQRRSSRAESRAVGLGKGEICRNEPPPPHHRRDGPVMACRVKAE